MGKQGVRGLHVCMVGKQGVRGLSTYLVPVTGTSPMARPDLGMILRELDVRACALIGSLQAMTCRFAESPKRDWQIRDLAGQTEYRYGTPLQVTEIKLLLQYLHQIMLRHIKTFLGKTRLFQA